MNLEEYTIQREETIIEAIKRRILADLLDRDETIEDLIDSLNSDYSFHIIMLTNKGAIVNVYVNGKLEEDMYVYDGGDLMTTDRYDEALGELQGQVVERYDEELLEGYFNNENKYIIENDFIVEREDVVPYFTIKMTSPGFSNTYEEFDDVSITSAISNAILELGYVDYEGDLTIEITR